MTKLTSDFRGTTNLQSVDGVLLDLGDERARLSDGVTWSQHQVEMLRDHVDRGRGCELGLQVGGEGGEVGLDEDREETGKPSSVHKKKQMPFSGERSREGENY